ncbi:hypothetical protein [Chryseobacterium kwangjuense]|uniref:Uncharacterized protein n=1 Tax=Chryseobacterium kwangjuense TaxID=267125 RepID=A0A135WHW5_9FLAO|nr:hypothetical protein [Chryseobacterium kwangjuense]KXH84509.1 hypothetical protein AU378_01725 [Chryseobacterium kwangjuense]
MKKNNLDADFVSLFNCIFPAGWDRYCEPQNTLHIADDGTKDPLRVDGLKPVFGSYVLQATNTK